MKNDNYFTADYFFDYSIESVSTIKKMGISIISYITGKISNGVYLEMEIDYFLLPNSVCYSVTHYYHRSLIYGYDSEKKKFNVIYTEKGKLIIDSIGYGDFITQMQKKDSHVMSIAFMPENIGYEFSIEVFKRNLESYRQGESVVKTDIIRHSNSYVYGMELYNVILKKDGLQTFIEDIRISYLFFEHKEIMYKRLRYLKEKKYIKSQKFDCIITNALDICNESKKIMQLCMKEAFSSKHENKEKIKIGMDLRIPIDTDLEFVKDTFKQKTAEYKDLKLTFGGEVNKLFIPKDSKLIKTLTQVFNEITNKNEEPIQ